MIKTFHQKQGWVQLHQSNNTWPWKFPGPGNFHGHRKSSAHGNFHPPWKIPWPMEISMLGLMSGWTRGAGSRIWQLGDLREHFFSILAWSITIINFSGHLWWASDRLLLWAVDFNLAAAFNWQILLLTPPTDNKNQTNGQSLGNNQEPDSGIETESCVKKVPKCESTCGC